MEWIAAGFDPGAFWTQTARSVQRALRGADKAHRRRLADAALAAWLGANASGKELQSFIATLEPGGRRPLPPEAAGHALQSMAANLGVITMDDYRARLRGQR